MKKPDKYILDEWNSMCDEANKSLRSDCPLLEDETLVEMNKYIGALLIELRKYENPKNWTRPYNYKGELINEHALYRPKLKDS